MHFITRQRTFRTVLLVLTLCQALSDQSRLSKFSNQKRNIQLQKETQLLNTKQQMQKLQNRLFVNSEMEQSNGEKRALTIIRVQKDGMTMDTVKVDDPKQSEMAHQEGKLDKSGSRVQNVFVPNVLSQLRLSPQPKIPSKPNRQKTTKLLDRLPAAGNLGIFYAVKPANLVNPVGPVVTTSHAQRDSTKVTNHCFNGTICVERICFRPQPLPSCPTTSSTSASRKILPVAQSLIKIRLVPTTTTKIRPVALSMTKIDSSTRPPPACCSCPGICVDVNLCNANQLPICSALPRCATGQCAQNCCGR